ncbi:PREDICTED: probable glutamate--tRNA ligase, mitochondrial [Branchiostoma belcheri]|uniref:Nondiscriminating glutamyl-tRNA synthetase EARS2, mitochondrial n=1 Tax=Branchiostoma belcheri TaxID=7741 RepID=A0A6P4YZW6_BRABE|nr:PREDICTED: probable glutamate--tRNA ligase, mitochondrial [Branchiostoma belcheri]
MRLLLKIPRYSSLGPHPVRQLCCSHVLQSSPDVRVRFAPSPTGMLHLGGLRTALYNFLFTKAHNGSFILRIEDTDRTRLVPGSEESLEEMLKWAGLEPDEGPTKSGKYGPYRQSERVHIYKEKAHELIERGAAYHCFCTPHRLELLRKEAARRKEVPRYDNRCRQLSQEECRRRLEDGIPHVIRFKLEDKAQPFTDLVFGVTRHDVASIEGDPVILKGDGFPTYHLANVVDDHLMQISHVLRGQEWLISTGKHLMLYRAFGWTPPQFAHLPLLVNKDGTKLSKRQGDIFANHFREKGYLPQAVLNFITFCGAGFQDNKQVRTLEDMVAEFSLARVVEHPARLDWDRLQEFQREHLTRMFRTHDGQTQTIWSLRECIVQQYGKRFSDISVLPDEYILKVLETRMGHFTLLSDLVSADFQYLWDQPDITAQELVMISSHASPILRTVQNALQDMSTDQFTLEGVGPKLRDVSKAHQAVKYSTLMKMLRFVLSGRQVGPSVAEMMTTLGQQETLKRLNNALSLLHNHTETTDTER